MEKLARINRHIASLSRVVNAAGVTVLLVMMMITVMDVCLRYFFSRRIVGAYELTEFTLVVVVFLAIAYTMIQKGHVGVEVLVSRLPSMPRAIVDSIATVLSLIIFSSITWRSVLFAKAQSFRGVTSAVLFIPVPPFILLVAFGGCLLCLVLLVQLCENVTRVLEKGNWKVWVALSLGILLAGLLIAFPVWLRQLSLDLSPFTVGFIGLGLLLVFLFSGMPIGFVMALVGFLGMLYVSGAEPSLAFMGRVPYATVANHAMSVLPLFVLMGQFVFSAGISEKLYHTAHQWIGHLPGGLAMATVGACAGFSAACGSSVATAATMGTIALPEMKQHNYEDGLATGSVAAGGTLGFLIPPSVAFCVIGLISEQSIGRLFMAGILPGIVLVGLFIVTIWIITRNNVRNNLPIARARFSDRIVSLKGVWGIGVLFILVLGGIYRGIFTPTEAAGIGAFGAFLLIFVRKRFTWENLYASLLATGQITAMIFTVWIGAMIFGYFITVTELTVKLIEIVSGLAVNRYIILLAIVMMYLILGCVMEFLAIAILTVPLVFPIMTNLGFDPIWLGVIIVLTAEMALITPPVGMNVYVIAGIAEDVPLFTIFRGILPFVVAMIVCIILLTVFPQIALFLPNLLTGG